MFGNNSRKTFTGFCDAIVGYRDASTGQLSKREDQTAKFQVRTLDVKVFKGDGSRKLFKEDGSRNTVPGRLLKEDGSRLLRIPLVELQSNGTSKVLPKVLIKDQRAR